MALGGVAKHNLAAEEGYFLEFCASSVFELKLGWVEEGGTIKVG